MEKLTHKQKKLIKFYEDRLEKVKIHWPLNSEYLDPERSKGYIKYAEEQLKEVKNGRNL